MNKEIEEKSMEIIDIFPTYSPRKAIVRQNDIVSCKSLEDIVSEFDAIDGVRSKILDAEQMPFTLKQGEPEKASMFDKLKQSYCYRIIKKTTDNS